MLFLRYSQPHPHPQSYPQSYPYPQPQPRSPPSAPSADSDCQWPAHDFEIIGKRGFLCRSTILLPSPERNIILAAKSNFDFSRKAMIYKTVLLQFLKLILFSSGFKTEYILKKGNTGKSVATLATQVKTEKVSLTFKILVLW